MSYDSRTELLIRKIMGETVVLEPPRSRIEELLYLLVDLGVSGGASSSDLEALAARIAAIESAMSGTANILGITTTALADEATTSTITVAGESVTPENGDIVFYENGEYLYSTADNKWHLLGSTSGTVIDVTVNGTSVVSVSGTAVIPLASYEGDAGVVRVHRNNGIDINNFGYISVYPASTSEIKAALIECKPIAPIRQHEATFYGLAKAAGDATQASSDNAVGTYTNEALIAISNMLGLETTFETVTVSGTDPVITAEQNKRYICGEVATLDFTPCPSGICEVMFTSGTTPTVLSIPQTLRMPEWFEVEAGYTYEISVLDGTYGAVMSWED